ncbi:response regulator transcription factor [Clostridium gasigenes]|uniref:response regulator transcription factor n=1 Tax=Clostridium gasigenes TaxID=94869 RepID=UPI0014382946|nr:response regulator transcription factor [Clostridium gasigenes]MBB6625261.1 response regulator transcription factor [Clostridium gasigenes]MBU3089906.1 response regulator transcription factor [Clostridium gasigenes]NKF07648.1 response regulator transcription factor [Clostridium gasigenes]QSW18075.1 response regulator transcription factor [Clostridium gasigenes]
MDKRILIVEDEIAINDILSRALKKEGYIIKSAYNGEDALDYVDTFKPHLTLLDVMLPDITGFDVASKISKKTYVIMVTAKDDISDKLKGADLGADDYITKPFDIREVKMRVKMVLRRENKISEEDTTLIIDEETRTVINNSININLKRKEFDLLYFLYSNKNRVFTRDELLNKVWGMDFFGDDRTVDVHIRRIREKLGENREDSIIKTIFGVGYVMR